jgi:hypothetical protein
MTSLLEFLVTAPLYPAGAVALMRELRDRRASR